MTVFPDWQRFAVHQRRSRTGCIPTAYEMFLRAAGAKQIDFDTFQDDFDLDIGLGIKHQMDLRNNFGSVAAAVRQKHPWVHFDQRSFASGSEKVAFIDDMLRQKRPVIVSLSNAPSGGPGWHMLPIVDASADDYTLLEYVENNGTPHTKTLKKAEVARIHDQFDGGKEVAFLDKMDDPTARGIT